MIIESVSTLDPPGYDAGKKVVGPKRHILTDTLRLLLGVVVHSAVVQDRDCAEPFSGGPARVYPWPSGLA